MTKFNDIYEIASENFGLITSAQAREVGISNKELVQYAVRGKLERVGQGVYRLVQRIPEPNDGYALAVALVGPGAFLYGEAVLGMLGLCPTNPAYLHIATPNRIRRNLPDYIRVVHTPNLSAGAVYDGVPCQRVADAIRSAMRHLLPDRLAAAITRGREEGYITGAEANSLMGHLEPELWSKRAHDLIDLQLVDATGELDYKRILATCKRLYAYRKMQPWPSPIVAGEGWAAAYDEQKQGLAVLDNVDEAVAWANELVARIAASDAQ